jgi:L-asparaginase
MNRGLVILGPGAAALSPSANEAAADLFAQGIPTVAVARPVTGTGVPDLYPEAVYVFSVLYTPISIFLSLLAFLITGCKRRI